VGSYFNGGSFVPGKFGLQRVLQNPTRLKLEYPGMPCCVQDLNDCAIAFWHVPSVLASDVMVFLSILPSGFLAGHIPHILFGSLYTAHFVFAVSFINSSAEHCWNFERLT
jgi:hypothetical protein